MSNAQRIALAAALVVVAGILGFAGGSRWAEPDVPGADSAEVGFLWDMIAHHEQALVMSQYQIADGAEPRVTKFAREIVQSQSYEIGLMEAYLSRWGQPRYRDEGEPAMGWMGHHMPVDEMPGMASDAELERLGELRGRDLDALFVKLMSEHHEGGVEMAAAGAREVEDPAVRALAERIARYQRVEIKEMEMTRVDLGLPVPG